MFAYGQAKYISFHSGVCNSINRVPVSLFDVNFQESALRAFTLLERGAHPS
jgi:hypothetical protein